MPERAAPQILLRQHPAVHGDVRRDVHRAARHPDRRLLAAGYRRRPVGGTGPDRLGADLLSGGGDHRHPAVGLADPGVLDTLAVHHLGGRLHAGQHAVRLCLEHRKHDRVPRAAGAARRVDDPDGLHLVVPLFPGTEAGLCGRGGRQHRLDRADARPRHRRLDHRHAELALAVLCQRHSGHHHHHPRRGRWSRSTRPIRRC